MTIWCLTLYFTIFSVTWRLECLCDAYTVPPCCRSDFKRCLKLMFLHWDDLTKASEPPQPTQYPNTGQPVVLFPVNILSQLPLIVLGVTRTQNWPWISRIRSGRPLIWATWADLIKMTREKESRHAILRGIYFCVTFLIKNLSHGAKLGRYL